DRVQQRGLRVHHPHAAATAAARRLDDHRIAHRARIADDLARILGQGAWRPRNGRYAGCGHRLLGRHLVAHRADRFRPRADEYETALLDPFGKVGVLGQEAGSRVNSLGVGLFGGADDRWYVQIGCARRRRPDAHRLVGQFHVLRVGVGLRVDEDGANAHLSTGALDAQGDFAPVRDQDLLEHAESVRGVRCSMSARFERRYARLESPVSRYSMTNNGCPYSTGCPFSTRIFFTVPPTSASISFSSFMASMMQSVSPALTSDPCSTKAGAPGLGDG